MSVPERTREIGTRKALGAKNSAIRVQFIVESMIICLIGGVIGVLLGTTLGRLGSVVLGAPSWPSPVVVLVAVTFSMAIGVISSTVISTWSPGRHISTFSGRVMTPVTSVVLK